jgi:hypothetical protein
VIIMNKVNRCLFSLVLVFFLLFQAFDVEEWEQWTA